MSKFQIILLAVFGAFILLAVILFSVYRSSGSQSAELLVWGDIPQYDFATLVTASGLSSNQNLSITYAEKERDGLESDLTEALATGQAPDLIILAQDEIFKNRAKLLLIPYGNISERNFKNTYIEEAELLMDDDGIYGLPLVVDPLVLYYNRDLLTQKGLARPLAHWDELYSAALALTEKDGAGNITKSVIAFGEAKNIPHYKEIYSLLAMQAGAPITQYFQVGEEMELRSALAGDFGLPVAPAEAALDFYTQFSNPAKAYYSWNRSLSSAQTHFLAGDSAYYIGFASELRDLSVKNPTLNFALTSVPQSRVSGKVLTYGKLRSIAITRGARDASAALSAALALTSAPAASTLAQALALPPARRDLLAMEPSGENMPLFYEAALQARAWLDPDREATANIFQDMLEAVTSGRARVSEAVRQASDELESLIR